MVVKNGKNSAKQSSLANKKVSVSRPLGEDKEASRVAERRIQLSQEALKHLRKVVLEVASKYEKFSGVTAYKKAIEQNYRLLNCMECLLTVSHHCRNYAIELIVNWMKEFQSKPRKSKNFLEELKSSDSELFFVYLCQLKSLQLLLDRMLLEKCEISKNAIDEMLSLTVEELINLPKNGDSENVSWIGDVVIACSEFLGSLSLFSMHEILTRFHGKMLTSIGSTSLSTFFNLRDSENENVFYLNILRGLKISLSDSNSIQMATELLEFYRALLTGSRSTVVKHIIADNISALLLQNLQMECSESTSIAKWYKIVDELYSLFQKWLTKPKHMAKGFPVCALLLKAKHADVAKRELWPFFMRCCKQYEDSKELQLKTTSVEALSHALNLYIRMKDPSSISTEQIQQILKRLLSPDRLFYQANTQLYSILAKCVIILINFSPHTCINILEDWWQNSRVISLSEVSYVLFQVLVFTLKEASSSQDEDLYCCDETPSAVEWSPEDKSKLARVSCVALKATHAYLDRTRSQATFTQDPSDIHCLLQLQLKGVQCLLDSIEENEIHLLYSIVVDLACQTESTFRNEAESLLLDMCRQTADAYESILYQISLKFHFRKNNPLDLSYAHVGRVIEVLNKLLAFRIDTRTNNNKWNEKTIGKDPKAVLLRIQETLILLYFLPASDLRRKVRDSLSLIQSLLFERRCYELEEISDEDRTGPTPSADEWKPRTSSKGTDDEQSYDTSSIVQFSRFLRLWRTFLSFTVNQSIENSKAGVLNAEQLLLLFKGHLEQSLQGNVKLHDRFPAFHLVNISFMESIELHLSLFFYILCSIDEQCKQTSSGVTKEHRSQLQKIFQLVFSPSLLGIDGTKSPLCAVYLSRLLQVLKHIPSQLSLYIALEAEELTFSVVHQQTKGRSKRQKDQYRICYAKILLALLDTLSEEDENNMNSGLLEVYSRFFSKLLQIMNQAVENPQNPFDLMALRETFCQCLLRASSLFMSTSKFPLYFKGIWKESLQLLQRWITSSNARKYSSASRGSSLFRTSFHDRSSREDTLTVEDLQDRIRRLSLVCVIVLLGYAEYFSVSKQAFHSVGFHLETLFSSLLEEFKNFDSEALEKLHCDYSMLKPAFLNMLRNDRKSLQTLLELAFLSNSHSNEVVAYHAVLLLLEYIHQHYFIHQHDNSLRNDPLCMEFFPLIYFVMGWDREGLSALALESLISLLSVASPSFSYESSLDFHKYFPSLCQDEDLINDISRRGAILCSQIASDIITAVFSKVKQSIKDNTEYNHPRILSLLGPWFERGDILESVMEHLLSLEETISEGYHETKLMRIAFDHLWNCLGYRKDNLQRAIHVLVSATSQRLKNGNNKRNNEKLEIVKRAAVQLSKNRVGIFLSNILSYILPPIIHNETMESSFVEDIPNVVILLSETVQRYSQDDMRELLPPIFHLATCTQMLNNISYQKHGRLLLANVISHFLLPYIERCCRQDVWRHAVQLAAHIAADMQHLTTSWALHEIAYSPEEMLSPRDEDVCLASFLEKVVELCFYCEPHIRTAWSRYCLTFIQYRRGHLFGMFSLRLYRLLGPCMDKESVDILLSSAKLELNSHSADRYRISPLLQIFYSMATKVEKENLTTVPSMLSFAFELNSSKDLWIRIHAAYLFTRLYSTGNSVGAGIFQQLLETEFCNRLEASPVMLHVCKMAIYTTQLQRSEQVLLIYLTLLLRIPWRQDNVQQRVDLVPVIVTTLMFLTSLLVSENEDRTETKEEHTLQLYYQTISEADLPSIPVEQSNTIAYFRIACAHLCYILKRLHLSSLSQTLQNFCHSSRKHWKVEDFLYQLRSPLVSLWLENIQVCQELVISWLDTNNSLSYRRGVLRLMEAILVQASQQGTLPRLVRHRSSDLFQLLISLVDDGAFHEETLHLLELLE